MTIDNADTPWGKIWFPAEDIGIGPMLQKNGIYSPAELDLLLSQAGPDKTIVEIGAHVGAFTLPLASSGARVYAFEYHPLLFNCLQKTLHPFSDDQVTIINAGIGKENRECYTTPLPLVEGVNTGVSAITISENGTNLTNLISIDSLDLEECHLMKIDVEGMEKDVLEGALHTLARLRPSVYAEMHSEKLLTDCAKLLADMDYQVFLHGPPYEPHSGVLHNTPGSRCIFASPEEKGPDSHLLSSVQKTNIPLIPYH